MQPGYAVMYRVVRSRAILASLIIPFPLRSIDSSKYTVQFEGFLKNSCAFRNRFDFLFWCTPVL